MLGSSERSDMKAFISEDIKSLSSTSCRNCVFLLLLTQQQGAVTVHLERTVAEVYLRGDMLLPREVPTVLPWSHWRAHPSQRQEFLVQSAHESRQIFETPER